MTDKEPEQNMFSLEPIVDYKMTDQEAKAFKVCLIWLHLCSTIIPEYKYSRLPKTGDPRKSHLFKMAWKLLRETSGILPDAEVIHYVRAQIEILKGIKRANGTHVLIDPVCLCGEKAWVRWQVWKKKFGTQQKASEQTRVVEERTPPIRVLQEVERTRAFFARFYDHAPTAQELREAVDSGNLRRWVVLQKVSPYYVLMSHACRAALQHLKIVEHFTGVDMLLYARDLTPECQAMLKAKFPAEFSP